VDLHDGFSHSHRIVVHVGIEKSKAASNEGFHLVGVKLVAHANFEGSRNDGDVLPVRMPMGRDPKPSGTFKRMVKSPVAAVGPPSRAANWAPGRIIGGAGPQGMVSGVKAFSWARSCVALVKANPAQENEFA
jgi:hypothetical protein